MQNLYIGILFYCYCPVIAFCPPVPKAFIVVPAWLLFITAVTVRSAGSQCVLSDEVCCASRFAHGVIQPAHGRDKVVQAKLPHQSTDAAGSKTGFITAAVRIRIKFHVPRIRIPVCRLQPLSGLHGSDVLVRKFGFPALTAEPLHGRSHHGAGIICCQPLYIRALWHIQHKGREQGAVDDIHLETVFLFKFRQSGNDLFITEFCFCRDFFCRIPVQPKLCGQILFKRFFKQRPHSHGHSDIFHIQITSRFSAAREYIDSPACHIPHTPCYSMYCYDDPVSFLFLFSCFLYITTMPTASIARCPRDSEK